MYDVMKYVYVYFKNNMYYVFNPLLYGKIFKIFGCSINKLWI